jgi:hypothetical protein
MTRAFEIALTPLIFGGLGWLLDRVLGTSPIFMLGLGVFAVAGVFVKMWIAYDHEMQGAEQQVDHRGRSPVSTMAGAPPAPAGPGVAAGDPSTGPRGAAP